MQLPTYVASVLNNRHLRLIILPTEKCNFRCTYCYEDFELGMMPETIVSGIENLVASRLHGLGSVQVSWFGGEPLLAKSIVSRLTNSIRIACESSVVDFSSDITTNALLLTPATFKQIHSVGVRSYQITLDGLRSDHDLFRVKANGGPSFDQILENLQFLKSTDLPFDVLLRLHYSHKTLPRLSEFAKWVRTEFGSDSRFSFTLREVEALGGPNDSSHVRIRLPNDIKLIQLAKQHLSLADSDGAEGFCYAGAVHSFVIRSDGRVGKCTVALNDSRNEIGTLNPNGTLTLDQSRTASWTEAALSGKEGALECPLHFLA